MGFWSLRHWRRTALTVASFAALVVTALVAVPPGTAQAAGTLSCDIYANGGTPCVAAHSTTFPVNGATYRITNLAGGKLLGAVNCGTANGTPIDQWQALGNACQQWRFTSAGANRWTITNVYAGKVLNAFNCGLAPGTAVNLWQPLGSICQQWAVVPVGNGQYELVVENSRMVLDNQNCGTANGTPVRLWMRLNSICQLWSIAP